jgi:hypothetical protein
MPRPKGSSNKPNPVQDAPVVESQTSPEIGDVPQKVVRISDRPQKIEPVNPAPKILIKPVYSATGDPQEILKQVVNFYESNVTEVKSGDIMLYLVRFDGKMFFWTNQQINIWYQNPDVWKIFDNSASPRGYAHVLEFPKSFNLSLPELTRNCAGCGR